MNCCYTLSSVAQRLKHVDDTDTDVQRKDWSRCTNRIATVRYAKQTLNKFKFQMDPSANRVNSAAFVSIPDEYFTSCRVTPELELSVYDVIAKWKECSVNDAGSYFRTLLHKFDEFRGSCESSELLRNYKFPGRGQRETPVAHAHVIHRILCLLPGDRSDTLRIAASEAHIRVIAGDLDLESILHARREEMSVDLQELLMTGLKRTKDATVDMQRRMDDVQRRMDDVKRDRDVLETKFEQCKKRRADDVSKLEATVTEMTAKANAAQAKVAALSTEADRAKAEVVQMEENLIGSQTRSSLAHATEELEVARSRADALRSRLSEAMLSQNAALAAQEKAEQGRQLAVKDCEQAQQGRQLAVKDCEQAEQGRQLAVKDCEQA